MLNVKEQLVTALDTILPCYYELYCDSTTETPCITYIETNNYDNVNGDTLSYSNIEYTIKIWGRTVDDISSYSVLVDRKMKELGYTRTSSNELTADDQIVKVMVYVGLGLEN